MNVAASPPALLTLHIAVGSAVARAIAVTVAVTSYISTIGTGTQIAMATVGAKCNSEGTAITIQQLMNNDSE